RRCRAAQRALDLQDRLVAERGGAEHLSILRFEMARSVAVLTAMVEDMQARWLSGDAVDPSAIATLLNARGREAEVLGIGPAPRDVTPALADYLASRATEMTQDSISGAPGTAATSGENLTGEPRRAGNGHPA